MERITPEEALRLAYLVVDSFPWDPARSVYDNRKQLRREVGALLWAAGLYHPYEGWVFDAWIMERTLAEVRARVKEEA